MYVSDSNLAGELAALGNVPGPHKGDCVLRLPGGGSYVVASSSLRLFAEGVTGRLPDGRGFFAHSSGLLVMDVPPAAADGSPGEVTP